MCWGDNAYSQLGVPSDAGNTNGPLKIQLAGGAGPLLGTKALALGDSFGCVITSDDSVACWGRNDRGQLGRGSSAPGESEFAVKLSTLSNVTSIATGDYHVCAKTNSGDVYCWGDNNWGQSAFTLMNPVPTPTRIGRF
jgi:alpha-tubulin suppressor-like RCC1 family protein